MGSFYEYVGFAPRNPYTQEVEPVSVREGQFYFTQIFLVHCWSRSSINSFVEDP
jgi:hypothetical protein